MATTSFRLSPDDEAILDRAAERYGSRSAAMRAALLMLDLEQQRRDALQEFVAADEAELGPVTDEDVAAMRRHFGRS